MGIRFLENKMNWIHATLQGCVSTKLSMNGQDKVSELSLAFSLRWAPARCYATR